MNPDSSSWYVGIAVGGLHWKETSRMQQHVYVPLPPLVYRAGEAVHLPELHLRSGEHAGVGAGARNGLGKGKGKGSRVGVTKETGAGTGRNTRPAIGSREQTGHRQSWQSIGGSAVSTSSVRRSLSKEELRRAFSSAWGEAPAPDTLDHPVVATEPSGKDGRT